MAAPQNFRTAFNGFHREDVVRYLEYLNTKHAAEINQLNSEADHLRSKLENAQPTEEQLALEAERDQLKAQVEELMARCEALEEALAAKNQNPEQEEGIHNPAQELEAYRRAERTERMAKERAELVYHQINGVLAEATIKVDSVSGQISGMADQVMSQLTQLQVAIGNSKQALKDAASTMYAIRPNE